jgi:hypothetical protein
MVNGNNLWLVSIHGNYFWSGGTNYRRAGRIGRMTTAVFHRNAANTYAVAKRAQYSLIGKKK